MNKDTWIVSSGPLAWGVVFFSKCSQCACTAVRKNKPIINCVQRFIYHQNLCIVAQGWKACMKHDWSQIEELWFVRCRPKPHGFVNAWGRPTAKHVGTCQQTRLNSKSQGFSAPACHEPSWLVYIWVPLLQYFNHVDSGIPHPNLAPVRYTCCDFAVIVLFLPPITVKNFCKHWHPRPGHPNSSSMPLLAIVLLLNLPAFLGFYHKTWRAQVQQESNIHRIHSMFAETLAIHRYT